MFTLFWNPVAGQITYTTISNGFWSNAAIWTPSVPPATLSSTDSIIINHNLLFDQTQAVLGVMIVNASASLNVVGNKNLEIGKGGIELGELINYGTITVQNLKVKPDNGCIPSLGLPVINNFGIINTTKDLHIGNNCGAGSFYNRPGGKVTVASRLHLDNYLCNADSMFVTVDVKVHGGTLDCCGYIETPLIDMDANGGRSGTISCIDICSSTGLDPVIDVGGTVYSDLNDAFNNSDPGQGTFDPTNSLICGLNQAGNPSSLPIKLTYFDATALANGSVALTWETSLEINNIFFTVESSYNGIDWQFVGRVDGAGNSVQNISYTLNDPTPFNGNSYYRLKQTDFDNNFEFSPIISINIMIKNQAIHIYPNPADNKITLEGPLSFVDKYTIYNPIGRDLSSFVRKVSSNQYRCVMDLSDLPTGMYILKTNFTSCKFYKQ